MHGLVHSEAAAGQFIPGMPAKGSVPMQPLLRAGTVESLATTETLSPVHDKAAACMAAKKPNGAAVCMDAKKSPDRAAVCMDAKKSPDRAAVCMDAKKSPDRAAGPAAVPPPSPAPSSKSTASSYADGTYWKSLVLMISSKRLAVSII